MQMVYNKNDLKGKKTKRMWEKKKSRKNLKEREKKERKKDLKKILRREGA